MLERDSQQPAEEAIWSDEPASEFKNKYIVRLMQFLSDNTRNNSVENTSLRLTGKM